MEREARRVMVLVVAVAVVTASVFGGVDGKVHKVGGSAGWTILGHVDYSKWASSHSFHVHDSLLFVYNTQFHNVKRVSHRDFLSCNASSAIATYTSGSDTVPLTTPGNYYYLCGFPGHCQAGQKLHVVVTSPSSSSLPPAPSPSPGLSPSGSAAASAPEVSAQNGAISWKLSGALAAAMSSVVVLVVG